MAGHLLNKYLDLVLESMENEDPSESVNRINFKADSPTGINCTSIQFFLEN